MIVGHVLSETIYCLPLRTLFYQLPPSYPRWLATIVVISLPFQFVATFYQPSSAKEWLRKTQRRCQYWHKSVLLYRLAVGMKWPFTCVYLTTDEGSLGEIYCGFVMNFMTIKANTFEWWQLKFFYTQKSKKLSISSLSHRCVQWIILLLTMLVIINDVVIIVLLNYLFAVPWSIPDDSDVWGLCWNEGTSQ